MGCDARQKVERHRGSGPTQVRRLDTPGGEVICLIDKPDLTLLPGTNVNAGDQSKVVKNALSLPKELCAGGRADRSSEASGQSPSSGNR